MTTEIPRPKSTFFHAFSPPVGCYHAFCACGLEFVSGNEPGANEAGKTAIHVDHSLGYIEFEGVTYVYNCKCWHERAIRIQSFIDSHFSQIADYMNGEIKRLKEEASKLPSIESAS